MYKAIVVVLVATLSGCAAAPTNQFRGSYSLPTMTPLPTPQESKDPNARIREESTKMVDGFAVSVSEYLKRKSQKNAIEQAQKVIADSLRDPSSAQFRNVRMVPYKDGRVICGEVNGKNAYGGYVGFKPFVSGVTSFQIARSGGRYAELDSAANTGLIAACG